MTFDPRSFLRERSYTVDIIIFTKSNKHAMFHIIVTLFSLRAFWALNVRSPLWKVKTETSSQDFDLILFLISIVGIYVFGIRVHL